MAADRKIRNNVNGSKSGGAPGSKNMDAAGSRHTMTNRRMFFTMLFSAVFRRRSRAAYGRYRSDRRIGYIVLFGGRVHRRASADE
jgi:hypothetical protein